MVLLLSNNRTKPAPADLLKLISIITLVKSVKIIIKEEEPDSVRPVTSDTKNIIYNCWN